MSKGLEVPAGMAARGGGCSHPGCGQLIGVSEAAAAGLMRCTKCRQKLYCSKACQVAGWKGGHKQECERQERVYDKTQ